jgi:hypothetical protein
VYEYQVTRYDHPTGEGGLFVDYINTFLKLKAEGSGYPCRVRGPEDEERYIESFWQSDGRRMERESTRANDARRGLAKLCLISMWGKWTERSDRA